MKATQKEIDNALALLAETPLRIAYTIKGIDHSLLQAKSDQKSWSANDILGHLRSCADVWGDSIDAMLAEQNPTVPYRHPRRWIKKTDYPNLSFHESFQAFVVQRRKLLKVLKGLLFNDWSRTAMIKGRKHTVFTQARRMALHEEVHCEQIESLLQSTARR